MPYNDKAIIWVLLWLVVVSVVQLQNKVYLTFVDIVELGQKYTGFYSSWKLVIIYTLHSLMFDFYFFLF